MSTDLAAFLHARIAEDEAAARQAAERSDGDLWIVTGADNPVGVDYNPARVLADCAAKHAIVKWATANPLSCGDIHPGADIYHFDGHDHPVLLALAQPWADHPDYHPDWQT